MSGSILKLIACIAMLIDHLAAFMPGDFLDMQETLFMLGDREITLRFICKSIGRTAFPLFAFLITEGFIHTSNRKMYGINLFMFAMISEIPWNLIHCGEIFYYRQNVFFTLLSGYLGICSLEYFKEDRKKAGFSLLALFIASIILKADYGCFGYGFVIMLYALRNQRVLMSILGACVLPSRWIGGMAFIPIMLYNGKRGFAKNKWAKYAFYAFYPAHLMIIYLLKVFVV